MAKRKHRKIRGEKAENEMDFKMAACGAAIAAFPAKSAAANGNF